MARRYKGIIPAEAFMKGLTPAPHYGPPEAQYPKRVPIPKAGKKKVSNPPKAGTDPLAEIFGLLTPEEIDAAARSAAAAGYANKKKEIETLIAEEQARTTANAELMKEVYSEFAQYLQAAPAQVQQIYSEAGRNQSAFARGLIDGYQAQTGQHNAAINSDLTAINAPASQQLTGDYGLSAKVGVEAQQFGDLLAAQGANWAAYVAMQPGIYSKFAVYNIGKLLKDSTHRIALLQAQIAGLSDDEAQSYADTLAKMQEDQYNRRIDYLKYQQAEAARIAKAEQWRKDYNLRVAAERNKNARFRAGLIAAGSKPPKPKKIDMTQSYARGHLVYTDGTDYFKNGARVPVAKPPAGQKGVHGKIDLTASQAAHQWVDAYGIPVPGMAGLPVPPKGAGASKPTPPGVKAAQNKSKDWAKVSSDMPTEARRIQNSKTKYTREQAAQLLYTKYVWWVMQYSSPGAGRRKLDKQLRNKIASVLDAIYGAQTGGGGVKDTNPFLPGIQP